MAAADILIAVKSLNHHDQLANRLWKHFLAKQNVDCDLSYCGRTVKLHKLLLDVLLLPDDQSAPSSNAGLHMPEKDYLDMMVEFLYLGTVDVHESQLKGLLKLATESNFKMLVDAIQQVVKREQDKNNFKKSEIGLASKLITQSNQKPTLGKAGVTIPKTVAAQSVVAKEGRVQSQTQFPSMPQARLQLATQSSATKSEASKMTNQSVVNEGHALEPVCILDASQSQLKLGMLAPVTNFSLSASMSNVSHVKKTSGQILGQSLEKQTVGVALHQFPVKSEQLTGLVFSDERPYVVNDDLDMIVVTDTANQATYKCDTCEKQFAFDADFQTHVRSHQNEQDHDINNQEDGKSLEAVSSSSGNHQTLKSSSNNHDADITHFDNNQERSVETSPVIKKPAKLFYCKMCHTFYRSMEALVAHKNSEHYVKIRHSYPCELCGKIYSLKSCLDRHRKVFHEKRVYKCDQCSKMLSSLTKLRYHKYQHGEKPFKCELCDKTFASAPFMRKHQRAKHLGEFVICDKCGRKFNDRDNLLRHITTHSETKDHKCTMCPKTYTNTHALKAHMISHGEKQHACDHCDKKFFLKGSLNHHLMTHAKNGIPAAQPKIIKRTRP